MKHINKAIADNTWHGAYTAVITPFDQNERFDEDRYEEQLERQIAGGIHGVVPVGTTGESPTLSFAEHKRVVKVAVRVVGGRAKVIAGTGGNSTAEAIELTQAAEKDGADASLQVVPYYNKPTQEGLFRHFRAIAQATSLRLFLYNIPGRSVVNMTVETVCRLRDAAPNIIGIKEASGSCDTVTELRARLGSDFIILCGDDSLTLPFMSVGADGVISVVSNVLPRNIVKLVQNVREGNLSEARKLHARLFGFTKSLFLEGNPVGVKCAMELLHQDTGVVRLPLAPVSKTTEEIIRTQLVGLGLL